MACVADGPDPAKNGAAIATKLVRDPDSAIRGDAARVLALAAAKGTQGPPASPTRSCSCSTIPTATSG